MLAGSDVGVGLEDSRFVAACQDGDQSTDTPTVDLSTRDMTGPEEEAFCSSRLSGHEPESAVAAFPPSVCRCGQGEGMNTRLGRWIRPVNRLIQTMTTQRARILP